MSICDWQFWNSTEKYIAFFFHFSNVSTMYTRQIVLLPARWGPKVRKNTHRFELEDTFPSYWMQKSLLSRNIWLFHAAAFVYSPDKPVLINSEFPDVDFDSWMSYFFHFNSNSLAED